MYPFDDHLQYIHGEISIKKSDRQPYTQIFDTMRDWLLKAMCDTDSVFKKLYTGTCLFGSYVNRVRILKPSEFDVFIVLEFPYEMTAVLDKERPGFVHLDLQETMENLVDDINYDDVYDQFYDLVDNRYMLKRTSFQWWINDIINEVLEEFAVPYGYSIEYDKHNVAHNLYVRQWGSGKTVSIDFVPAIRLDRENWMHISPPFHVDYFDDFLVIPKYLPIRGNRNRKLTFQVVNPEAERDILWDHKNLKVVYRLLKSLRNRFKLRRIKSYYLTTIFLWEIQSSDPEDWEEPVSDIFVRMLGKLCDYFDERHLPYFWNKNFNLLSILKPEEITEYAKTLNSIWKTLKSYPHQPLLKYETTDFYFELPCDLVSD